MNPVGSNFNASRGNQNPLKLTAASTDFGDMPSRSTKFSIQYQTAVWRIHQLARNHFQMAILRKCSFYYYVNAFAIQSCKAKLEKEINWFSLKEFYISRLKLTRLECSIVRNFMVFTRAFTCRWNYKAL